MNVQYFRIVNIKILTARQKNSILQQAYKLCHIPLNAYVLYHFITFLVQVLSITVAVTFILIVYLRTFAQYYISLSSEVCESSVYKKGF